MAAKVQFFCKSGHGGVDSLFDGIVHELFGEHIQIAEWKELNVFMFVDEFGREQECLKVVSDA